ncbi:2-phospho-L-lactate guanylyltransferase [Streptomyces ipomoeae]|uniref:Phosphoenolpyruvate guanylyltransferase n=2 Tax=Streptomyces ipomoeae TaxID=103232 RepID=L1KZN2_9ACTN|nr:2-phospho-L-lactate guanylyltransferase [Streptomyces ipomoeae]EKX66107.1 2-phospho-L-lactate guanylyltransferase CofC [Streptomyces ipomoeae 91-03]MDX2692707.1 2-phospho-L-lactate guanylyltransferase [Streptomyces ipomoeae]MDX2822110.1 2-phospho-L-lactate guanylyltransferase [Streptomyces ipomoeae]MDX2838231.1 2-phospho-L-lactate guanylyltransferase [Streptomyces ipomoeae]MDX2872995.1 2-phospho-L-lactate guanylyltransferase [Streptomyces ipomoeae]
MQWTLVVPLKPLARAKSRLSDTADDRVRPGLALAFAQDTVAAALTCPAVGGVVVVTDDHVAGRELAALGARVVPDDPRSDPANGLNAALRHGAALVRAAHPRSPMAALNADLPALRSAELTRVLEAAAEFPRAFLADVAGTGTTLLAAAPGRALRPAFGPDSRLRHHRSGATELALDSVDSVRQDVDTGEDLRAALTLGVGPRTAAATARLLIPGQ